jgi:hypothetical protein
MSPVPKTLRWVVPVAAGILLLSCARGRISLPLGWQAGGGGGAVAAAGPAVGHFGPAPGPRMNHAAHLDKGLECADCHAKGAKEGQPFEPRKMSYDVCAECHDEEDAKKPDDQKVKAVFFAADGSPKWSKAIGTYGGDLRFSHAKHATDSKSCTPCHGTMNTKGAERFVGMRFTMAACMDCHAKKGGSNACQVCHAEIRDGVAPPSHRDGDWRGVHGKLWASDAARTAAHCELCHKETASCDACHKQTKPASHEQLWKERHGQVAMSARDRQEGHCDLCHDDRAFCDRCHREERPRSHDNLWRLKTHGVMAAMDRNSCAACHQTDYCVRCHEETAPLSHRGRWTVNPAQHCLECHFPVAREESCRVCHFEEPQHETAPQQPGWHVPGMNCRNCHLESGPGPGGAPRIPHYDNGSECQHCHKN